MTGEADDPNDARLEGDGADADLIGGGDGIARFLFGIADDRSRREVYHLAEQHELPTFKVGNKLYARRKKLLEWIEARERHGQPPRA